MSFRFRRASAAASITTLAVALASCTSPGADPLGGDGGGSPAPTSWTLDGPAQQELSGHVYLMTGPDAPLHADLYVLHGRRIDQLTHGARISVINSNSSTVIVATARERVDHLAKLTDGELEPLPGIEDQHAMGPALSEQDQLAYVTIVYDKGSAKQFDIQVYDLNAGKADTVMTSPRAVSPAAWGPRGELALNVDAITEDSEVLILHPDDQRTRLDLQRRLQGVEWSRSGWLAVNEAKQNFEGFPPPIATILIDPKTDIQTRIDGWAAMAWSPDGKQLLVTRGAELGIVKPEQSPTQVEAIGTSPLGTIYNAGWTK